MKIKFLLAFLLFSGTIFAQGTTTSELRGAISDESNEPLIGANILAVHVPSGTTYGTATDLDGYYRIPNMRVGGPYKVTVTYTGFSTQEFENLFFRLGEAQTRDFTMGTSSIELDVIQVVATAGIAGQSSGTSTQIGSEEIDAMPTLNRDISDFVRLSPQASRFGDGTSFAGVNNRFNAIYIDGAVNNDVFGLSSSGTNGGQTGASPFSMDIIDQFQIVLSPYDVSLGGFAGGGINAVTKSGTNKLSGTAYYFFQNESLAGKTNQVLSERLGLADDERTKLDPFTQKTFGASLGGPIVKDKVFFFANVEIQDDETPSPFETALYTGEEGRASVSDLQNLRDFVTNSYGYDPGGFSDVSDQLKGTKLFGKLDFNLNENHRLTVRHQYTKAEQFNRNAGFSRRINFSNNGVFFPSVTNSSALELNSRFGTKASNNLIIGLTSVKDDRDGLAGDFPYVTIEDGSGGDIQFGTEQFSTGNALDQTIFTLTDNFKIYKGDHTLTFGTHNEFYSIYNLFVRQNFGAYRFASLSDFLTNQPAIEYNRSYSLVDDISGDGSAAGAEFNALQLGFYAQDEYTVNKKLTLTGGIRLDIPIITSDPAEDTYFNSTALPKMQAAYPIASDARAGAAPDGQLMISPRVGFEYSMNDDRSSVLRGGIGVFTSRIPFVWPGAMFSNNGLTIGSLDERDLTGDILFNPNPQTQPTNPDFAIPSGQMDLFAKDFKYPQVLRGNLAFDKKFNNGLEMTFEGTYTKTLNNIVYTNINSDPTVDFTWTGSPDNRPVYGRDDIDETYSAVYLGHNTSEGYTYTLTASAAKQFGRGLKAYIAYTYGDAFAINEGTSSQNSSQWRGQVSTAGRNNPIFGRSDYATGSRVVSSLTYKHNWTQDGGIATTVSLFYNGQTGGAYSHVIQGGSARNLNNETGSTSRNRGLIYVPSSANDINLVDYTLSSGTVVSAAQQWADLDAFISNDSRLNDSRGGYAEKNGSFLPYSGIFDLAIRQDLGANIGGGMNRIQISLDVFNVANLISGKWGVNYFVPGDFNNYFLYEFEGYAADGTTPEFTYQNGDSLGKDDLNIGGTSSRWRMRLGVRYLFN